MWIHNRAVMKVHTHMHVCTHACPQVSAELEDPPPLTPYTAKQRGIHTQLHTLTYTLAGSHTYIHTHLDMLLRAPTPRVTEHPLPRYTLKTLTQTS